MKKYDKIVTLKTDVEMHRFLKSLPKKSNFIRVAILEKIDRENLIKKYKRKNTTLADLMNSFSNFEKDLIS